MEDKYQAIHRLMLAINKIDGAYYFFARKLGIKENTLALLCALDDGKAHSQKQIGEEWQIPKTTINTVVKELIDDGYITLQPEEHTREKTLCLTDKGRAYTKKILTSVYEAEQEALEKTLREFSPEFIDAFDCFAARLCEEFQKRNLK